MINLNKIGGAGMRYKISWIFFLINIVAFVGILSANELEETFRRQVPVGQATRLTVENRNGSITVSGYDGDQVEIIAYKKVRGGGDDAARLMDELKINVDITDSNVEVSTEYPGKNSRHSHGFFSWIFGLGRSGNMSVSYKIRVPLKFDLDLSSLNGSIKVNNCEGRMRLETTNGRIVADDVKGSIRCETTNGSIRATFLKVLENDEMSFSSTNGSIKLYLPQKTPANISARTTNGSVRCDLPMERDNERSRKHLEAEVNGGGPRIYLRTTNGSIRISES